MHAVTCINGLGLSNVTSFQLGIGVLLLNVANRTYYTTTIFLKTDVLPHPCV